MWLSLLLFRQSPKYFNLIQQRRGEGEEQSSTELFIAHTYFIELLLRHSLCVSSMRTGKAVLLDACSAKFTATRSWRQQTPKPSAFSVHAHARFGTLLSPPWAFSSMVGQDPCLGLPNRTSTSGQAQRQAPRPETGASQESARKKLLDRSCTLSVSLPAQGTRCSVAVSDGSDEGSDESTWCLKF